MNDEHTSIPPDAAHLGVGLADVAMRNTAQLVADRMRQAKANADHAREVTALTDIINDLLADKAALVTIAREMDAELVAQKVDESDLQFITDTLIPAFESLTGVADDPGAAEAIATVKTLVTLEMLTVLQLVGFNYREAIGQPLAEVVAALIRNLVPSPRKTANQSNRARSK